jgi:hypothetical protein
MALSNDQKGSKTFLSVVGGKISQKVSADTPGAVERVNKNGAKIHELKFSSVSGIVRDVKLKEDATYGNQYEISIQDADENYVLQVPQSGRLASSFLSRIPNMDRTGYIKIETWSTEEDGKTKQFLTVRQNDKVVPPFYSKDNPNGLPQMTQVKVKGIMQWDDSDQLEFYKGKVTEWFTAKPEGSAAPAANLDPDDDQLPF